MNTSTKALISVLLFTLLPLSVFAHNKVVVIPMSGDDAKPLKNIVSVAKQNGDFSDPIAAMSSIQDASESNPYLIVIAPGIYNLNGQLVLKDFVNISGSGKEVTTLRGNVSADDTDASALILASDNLSSVSIQDITIFNESDASGGSISTGIFSKSSSVELSNVQIDAKNLYANGVAGSNNCNYQLNSVVISMNHPFSSATGVSLDSLCKVTMLGGSVKIQPPGGQGGYITSAFNLDTPREVAISNVEVYVSGGFSAVSTVYGFNIVGDEFADTLPPMTLSDIKMTVVSPGATYGVYINGNSASLSIDSMNMIIYASGGAHGYLSNRTNTKISDSSIKISAQGEDVVGIKRDTDSSFTSFDILSTKLDIAGTSMDAEPIGIQNLGTTYPMTIRNSEIEAQLISIEAAPISNNNYTYVSDSLIQGEVVGTPRCDFVFNKLGISLNSQCDIPPPA